MQFTLRFNQRWITSCLLCVTLGFAGCQGQPDESAEAESANPAPQPTPVSPPSSQPSESGNLGVPPSTPHPPTGGTFPPKENQPPVAPQNTAPTDLPKPAEPTTPKTPPTAQPEPPVTTPTPKPQREPTPPVTAPRPDAKPAFEGSGKTGFEIGDVAPEIEGADLDEVPFALSDYRGKVVVLDFWGDW